MSDIVERLTDLADYMRNAQNPREDVLDLIAAAFEITRLRSANAELVEALEKVTNASENYLFFSDGDKVATAHLEDVLSANDAILRKNKQSP